jgi:hypothetical protein
MDHSMQSGWLCRAGPEAIRPQPPPKPDRLRELFCLSSAAVASLTDTPQPRIIQPDLIR